PIHLPPSLSTASPRNLSFNRLSGTLVPSSFMHLEELYALPSLHSLRCTHILSLYRTSSSTIPVISLSNNVFTGSVPPELIAWNGNMQKLDLSYNQLSGTVPTGVTALDAITNLDLSHNDLSGPLPTSIGSITTLKALSVLHCTTALSLPPFPLLLRLCSHCNILFQQYTPLPSLSPFFCPENLCSNQISGTLPTLLGGLLKLEAINLRNNQLTGPVLQPIPANLTVYDLDNNYLSSGFSSPPNCSERSISFRFNCLQVPSQAYSCPTPATPSAADAAVQRPEELCDVFCGVSAADPPCGGHGSCYVDGPNRVPTCDCHPGFVNGELPGSCVPEGSECSAGGEDGGRGDPFPACLRLSLFCCIPLPPLPPPGQGVGPVTVQPTAAQTAVKGGAAVASNGLITLTASQPNTWGAAFFKLPVPLFSFALKAGACGRPLAFTVYFSFSILKPAISRRAAATAAGDAGDGFAFVISASGSATGGSSGSSNGSGGGGSLGYAGMDERSIAVEFDTARSTDANDPVKSHVGVSVRGNTSSIATAKAPFSLNDGKPKHAWIVFDPSPSSSAGASDGYGSSSSSSSGMGSLRVFLSGKVSHRPGKAVLAMQVSLCEFLQPSAAEASFRMGFTASSSESPQLHSILTWNITTAEGWYKDLKQTHAN
ncbi:unnamed protein product, partial [Closterium sp. NIES-65]